MCVLLEYIVTSVCSIGVFKLNSVQTDFGKRSKLHINQTPSVDSYTTILPVQILVLLTLLKTGFDRRRVEGLNGSV